MRRTCASRASASSDELDGTPNTATLRVQGFVPSVGDAIDIYQGDTFPSHRLFHGTVLTCVQVYDLIPAHLCYDLSCISNEWRLNQFKVTERYLSQSATAIVLDLCATYAPWVDTSGVEAGLPSLAEITFTNEDFTDCLDRIKDRREIGGRWVLTAADVLHFGTTIEPGSSAVHPISDGASHGLIRIAATTDLSQVRTRVLVEGGGSAAASELVPGETLLPVEDAVWYDATLGGTVVSGPQRITYTGVEAGGGGALVGTSTRPSNGPILTLAAGSGIESGTHKYAVVFKSATGTTLPSPETSIVIGGASVAPPTTGNDAGVIQYPPGFSGSLDPGAQYDYKYTFREVATGKETTPSPNFGHNLNGAAGETASLLILRSMLQAPPAGLTRRWYRTVGNASPKVYYFWRDGDPAPGTYPDYILDNTPDSSLNTGIQPPSVNGFTANQAALSAIAIGPTGTTAREIYRTAAGASQLKLLTTLANNTASTYTDSTADASLGANAPIADTSGLVAETGNIAPGASEIRVTATTAFRAAGGWAAAGGQFVRYSALSATSLTGIPATGSGAIGGPLNYGSEVTALPMLIGIPASGAGAIVYAIAKGDEVNLLVTRNDIAAQATLAALLDTAETPHNGVIEDYIQDRRLSQTEAEARGDARLEEVKDPEVHVNYETRDQTTRSGRDIAISLTAPAISGTFKIQRVGISDFDPLHRIGPVRQVDASSRKFTLEQLLRLVKVA